MKNAISTCMRFRDPYNKSEWTINFYADMKYVVPGFGFRNLQKGFLFHSVTYLRTGGSPGLN